VGLSDPFRKLADPAGAGLIPFPDSPAGFYCALPAEPTRTHMECNHIPR
jgi:hypothetical protein